LSWAWASASASWRSTLRDLAVLDLARSGEVAGALRLLQLQPQAVQRLARLGGGPELLLLRLQRAVTSSDWRCSSPQLPSQVDQALL
jgi:hypothetical protein